MALKKPFRPMEAFSMSSMTDVIFLLLIFFMVTSTIIFPSAIDVNLPQSTEQTALKPVTEVYVDSAANYYLVEDRNSDDILLAREKKVSSEELFESLRRIQSQDSLRSVALYADERVDYGKVIEILDLAARNRLRLVLATRAASPSAAYSQSSEN
ncbi:MAG: biopolymer transporter ExbD [Bacteroidales bacterium]|nr:biopolymer transporter ExbD [Bacteroidales bacterium]MBD5190529.1 biopolymer transporter ExbD [Bacteroidales bacterium]MBD5209547.1 biopolymer transporter ExbD [Bacteroidales bacterium]MDE6083466.1 biopolymer transporter ExbD [Muribaculaceae bacterium]